MLARCPKSLKRIGCGTQWPYDDLVVSVFSVCGVFEPLGETFFCDGPCVLAGHMRQAGALSLGCTQLLTKRKYCVRMQCGGVTEIPLLTLNMCMGGLGADIA